MKTCSRRNFPGSNFFLGAPVFFQDRSYSSDTAATIQESPMRPKRGEFFKKIEDRWFFLLWSAGNVAYIFEKERR